ncbi:MAG: hypothetical protein JWL72_4263 [Ilumatobacteraceae bacterium]|nr:hypothetical protein [Ilumatobacteraceae bacterium]
MLRVVVICLGICVGRWATTAVAARPSGPVRAGDLTIVDGYAQARTLTHGDGRTIFSVTVPGGATCPGDSTNDQWRVQTFMVPANVAGNKIVYTAFGPYPADDPVSPAVPHASAPGWNALVGVDSNPVVDVLIQHNDGPGQRGVVAPFGPMSFEFLDGYGIPSGAYRVGVVCTLANVPADYWDTEVVVEATGTKSGDLLWRLSSEPASANHPAHSSGWITFGSFVVVALGALFLPLLFRRRSGTRRRAGSSRREPSAAPVARDQHLANRQPLKESS